jgi:hypothetical protein
MGVGRGYRVGGHEHQAEGKAAQDQVPVGRDGVEGVDGMG